MLDILVIVEFVLLVLLLLLYLLFSMISLLSDINKREEKKKYEGEQQQQQNDCCAILDYIRQCRVLLDHQLLNGSRLSKRKHIFIYIFILIHTY